ncbi:hypothetical protein M885DRAFT_617767 [Pelagophyceae sp. CCMP2097]|nr:hypothetical protein M885DRAFT_617767 [Pelagophyceae sp. CCMP2097]
MVQRSGGGGSGGGGGKQLSTMKLRIADVTSTKKRIVDETKRKGAKQKTAGERVNDVNVLLLCLDVTAIFLSCLSIELGWHGVNWESTFLTESLKACVSVISVCSVVLLLLRYQVAMLDVEERLACEHSLDIDVPSFSKLVIEVLVHAAHVPPGWTTRFKVGFVRDALQAYYPADNLNALLVVRLYKVVRVICEQSYYDDEHVQAVGALNHITISQSFVLKCVIRRSPLFTLGSSGILMTCWGAYNIRLWERTLYMDEELRFTSADWSNAFWLVFVTMTSVGYGDYTLKTHLGRTTASVCVLLFTLFISLFIGVVADEMQLGDRQEKVYEYAQSHDDYRKLRDLAAQVIQEFVAKNIQLRRSVRRRGSVRNGGLSRPVAHARLSRRGAFIARRMSVSTSALLHASMHSMQSLQPLDVCNPKSGVSLALLRRFRLCLLSYNRTMIKSSPSQLETQVATIYDASRKHASEFRKVSAWLSQTQDAVTELEKRQAATQKSLDLLLRHFAIEPEPEPADAAVEKRPSLHDRRAAAAIAPIAPAKSAKVVQFLPPASAHGDADPPEPAATAARTPPPSSRAEVHTPLRSSRTEATLPSPRTDAPPPSPRTDVPPLRAEGPPRSPRADRPRATTAPAALAQPADPQRPVFSRAISRPLKEGDPAGVTRLRVLVWSLALRRPKALLAAVLVPKTVETRLVDIGHENRAAYDALFKTARACRNRLVYNSPDHFSKRSGAQGVLLAQE